MFLHINIHTSLVKGIMNDMRSNDGRGQEGSRGVRAARMKGKQVGSGFKRGQQEVRVGGGGVVSRLHLLWTADRG